MLPLRLHIGLNMKNKIHAVGSNSARIASGKTDLKKKQQQKAYSETVVI